MDNIYPLNVIPLINITKLSETIQVGVDGIREQDEESVDNMFWMMVNDDGEMYIKNKTQVQVIADFLFMGFADGGFLVDVEVDEATMEATITVFKDTRVVYRPNLLLNIHSLGEEEYFRSVTHEKDAIKAFLSDIGYTIVSVVERERGHSNLLSTEGWP